MKCLHCQIEIHSHLRSENLYSGSSIGFESGGHTFWSVDYMQCPACKKALIWLKKNLGYENTTWPVYPLNSNRPPAPAEVPSPLADDFNEASSVLSISPKSSAALSRRCLQELLRQQGFIDKDLAPAIQRALDSRTLPAALAENLDAIRNIGNFAAHPLKDKSSGQILDVEPHEAEWNLEVLEGLFDFYYVQPSKAAARRAALDEKLKAAGKPPMKSPM